MSMPIIALVFLAALTVRLLVLTPFVIRFEEHELITRTSV